MFGLSLTIHDPVLIFAVVLLILLAAPMLASKARLPGIIGLIIAGVIVGPYGLHILERDKTIELLGMVGLLYIMFLAGLEINVHQIKKKTSHGVIFGILTFIIPLGLGIVAGVYVLGFNLPSAILLASMFSSHTLVSFPIITNLGLTKSGVVTTAIGGTIITDTLAMLVLAVIAGSAKGDINALFWIRLSGLLTAFCLVVFFVLPRFGQWFLRKAAKDGMVEFVFILAMGFLFAYLSHLAGVEPIIGAFLAGLALNSLIPEKSLLMNRLEFVGNALFIPFFLLSVGMLVDVRRLTSGLEAWITAGVMIAVVTLTKFIAALVSSVFLKYKREERGVLFGLSINQAAATLAAVLVGYNLGIFNDSVLTGTILMIAVTCFIGPLITDRSGRKLAALGSPAPMLTDAPPCRILIPLSSRMYAKELMDLAFIMRGQDGVEPLYPVNIVPEGKNTEARIAMAENILAHAVVRGMAAGFPVVPITRVDANVPDGILSAARDFRISLLVFGWKGEKSGWGKTFSPIIDRVLAETSQAMIVAYLPHPVNTASRLVLALPPFAERLASIGLFMSMISRFAAQKSASVLIMGYEGNRRNAELVFKKAKPSVAFSYHALSETANFTVELLPLLKKGDMIFVTAARPGRLSWQPQLNRLPLAVAKTLPDVNIVVCYSSDGPEDESSEDTPIPSMDILFPDFARFDLAGLSSDAALHALLTDIPGLFPALSRMYAEEPVELVEGVVLLHVRTQEVRTTTVILGVNKEGFPAQSDGPPVKIILILLDPEGLSSEDHLKVLGKLARLVQHPEFMAASLESASLGEFLKKVALPG